MPKSYSKNKRLLCTQNVTPPTCKPDWDNIGKALCDALNGVAYGDDASIYDAHIVKRWGPCPAGSMHHGRGRPKRRNK